MRNSTTRSFFSYFTKSVAVLLVCCMLMMDFSQFAVYAQNEISDGDVQVNTDFDYPSEEDYTETEDGSSEDAVVPEGPSSDSDAENESVSDSDIIEEESILKDPELFGGVDLFEARYGDPVSVSQYEKTYMTGADSFLTVLSHTPNTYFDSRGAEHEIDNTLVKKFSLFSGSYYQNKANSYTVKLPAEMDYNDGAEYISDGVSVELIPLEGSYDLPVAAENAILYNHVFDGVDVQYSIFENQVKEYIVLNKVVDRNTFTYELKVSNAKVELVEGKIAVTKNNDTEPDFYITAPEMFDAAGKTSNALTLSLEYLLGRYYVTLTVDEEWLNAPERSYPVKIDPTVEILSDSVFVDTYTQKHDGWSPGGSYSYIGNVTEKSTGVAGAAFGTSRIHYGINYDFTTIPTEAKINSAELRIYQYTKPAGSDGIQFICYMLKDPVYNGINWQSFASLSMEPASDNAVSNGGKGYHRFDITSAVNYWAQGVYPNYGLVVKAVDETYTAPAFYTSASGDYKPGQGNYEDSMGPYIVIDWSVPDPVDVDYSINSTTAEARPIIIAEVSGKLNTLGVTFDGMGKPGSLMTYSLNDESIDFKGETAASFSYKYPNTLPFESAFPEKATKYRDKLSNWQNQIPLAKFEYDTNYYLNATATYGGETGSNATSDNFVIYQVKQFDTLPKIASYYGVPLATIVFDNRVQDMLLVENNTLFIRNPKVEEPYNPPVLSEQDKIKIDSLLMGRALHCEFGYEPINLNTGNFIVEHEDYFIPDYDGNFSLLRTYNSKAAMYNSIFGRGWSFQYSQGLAMKENGDIVYLRGDGSSVQFVKNGDYYTGPEGYYLTLRRIAVSENTVDLGAGEETYTVYEYEITDADENVYRFNAKGSLVSITNYRGRTTSFEYDENQQLVKLTAPAGNVFNLAYNDRGYVAQIKLPSGYTVSYAYDDNGNLVKVIDAMGYATSYTYDAGHRMTSWADGNGTTIVTNTYDEENRVLTQTDGEGNTTSFSYSDGQTVIVDADGYTTTYKYDSSYRTTEIVFADGTSVSKGYSGNSLAWETDELGHKTAYSYDANGNITGVTRYDGAVASYEYNSLDLPTKAVDFDGSVRKYKYDAHGNLTAETDEAGNTLHFSYDGLHRLVQYTDANGNVMSLEYSGALVSSAKDAQGNKTSYAYNANGLVTSATMSDGGVYRYMYNNNGWKTGEQSPEGEYTQYAYDKAGNVTSIIDPNGNTSRFAYNSLGDIVRGTDPQGGTIAYTYDGRGNVRTETDGDGCTTTYTYDCKSNVVSEKNADGYTAKFGYDKIGNLTSVTDGNGNTTAYSYDYRFNYIDKVTDAMGYATEYTYSDAGNVTSVKNPDGTQNEYKYDELDRLVEATEPNGLKTEYTYDKNGNLLKTADNSGRNASYTYNSMNMLTGMVDAKGNSTSYEYDSRQRLTAITDSLSGVTGMKYDKSGRVTSLKDANGNAVTYSYDANGNITKQVDANGNATSFAYNKVDRLSVTTDANGAQTKMSYTGGEMLSGISDALGGSSKLTYNGRGLPTSVVDAMGNKSTFAYDGNGNLLKITLPDGNVTSYTYDALNRVTSIKESSGLITEYTYNPMGYVLSEKDNAGNEYKYTYDSVGNLLTATNSLGQTAAYEYDLVGNIVSETTLDGSTSEYQYDLNNNLVSAVDPEGKKTVYSYDKLNRLIGAEDSSDRSWGYTYDAGSRLTSFKDPSGATETYSYDKADNLVVITDSADEQIKYSYDAAGNLIEQTDRNGNKTKLGYDALGRVINSTFADGSEHEYLYDANSNLIKEKDALGSVTEYGYDSVGNIVSITSPKGGKYSYTYDSQYNNTSITDPLGNVTTMAYDLNGNMVSRTLANGGKYKYSYDVGSRLVSVSAPTGESLTFTYDKKNDIVSQKDNAGNTVSYKYDVMHRLVQETNELGNATKYTYDANGNLASVVAPSGATTAYTYDVLDRVTGVTNAVGQKSSISYDIAGNIDKIVNSGGRTTSFAYDANGNMLSMTNAMGDVSRMSYDSMNRIVKETDAAGHSTSYTYDAVGQIVGIRSANSGEIKLSYDANGNLSRLSDALGNAITYEYDQNDRLVSAAQGDVTTQYSYDSVGNIISVTNGEGASTTYAYDLASRLVSTTNPLDEVTGYTYDKSGNLSKVRNADGTTISYDYDALDELVSKEYSDAETPSVMYGYDVDGNCVSMEDFSGTNSYKYDKLGRIVSVKMSTGDTVSYSYDECGNINKLTYPDGSIVRYVYDKLDRLVKVIDRDGGETVYTYDKLGNVIKTTRPNKTYSTVEYNSIGLVTHVENYDGEGALISEYSYEYDLNGSIVKETVVVEGEKTIREFTYNNRNELTSERITAGRSVVITNYIYDGNGNRVKVTADDNGVTSEVSYFYDEADRLVRTSNSKTRTTTYYKYDENGNRVRKSNSNGDLYEYEYDAENRLLAVKDNGSLLMAALYDGNGERVFTVNRSRDEYTESVSAPGVDNTTVATDDPDGSGLVDQMASGGLPQGTVDMYAFDERLPADPADTIFWYGFGQGMINSSTVSSAFLSLWFNEAWQTITEKFDVLAQRLGGSGSAGEGEGFAEHTMNAPEPDQPLQEQLSLYQTMLIPYGIEDKTVEDYEMLLYVNDINTDYTNALMTYGTDGNINTVYTYGNERLISEQFGKSSYYSYNGRGDVVGLTTASGALNVDYSYDAYGNVTADGRSDNPYGFNAESVDPSTGLQYLRARYYDSEVGSFITQDTYRGDVYNPMTLNLYDYVGNDPLNLTDPSGHGWIKDKWNQAKNFVDKHVDKIEKVAQVALAVTTVVASVALAVAAAPVAAVVATVATAVAVGSAVAAGVSFAVMAGSKAYKYNKVKKANDAENKQIIQSSGVDVIDCDKEPTDLSTDGSKGYYQYYNAKQKKLITFKNKADYLKYIENCEGTQEAKKEMVSGIGHSLLDALGMIPVAGAVFDGANGIWYTAEGDKLNAWLSYASAGLEVVSWAKSLKQIKNVGAIDDVVGSLDNNVDDIIEAGAKTGDDVVEGVVDNATKTDFYVDSKGNAFDSLDEYDSVNEPLDWDKVVKEKGPNKGETRTQHVEKHQQNDLQKPEHGVFYGDAKDTINKAWENRAEGTMTRKPGSGTDEYVIPYPNAGYAGGYKGQRENLNYVSIVTKEGTSQIITGFPGNTTKYKP